VTSSKNEKINENPSPESLEAVFVHMDVGVRVPQHHVTETYGGCGDNAPHIINSDSGWRLLVTGMIGNFTPPIGNRNYVSQRPVSIVPFSLQNT
jgi:hypothetical protein